MKTFARLLFVTLALIFTLPAIQSFANDPSHHGPTWAEENNSRYMRMREYEARRDFGYRHGPQSAGPGANVPINGGIALLLMAGIGFGVWKAAAGRAASTAQLPSLQ